MDISKTPTPSVFVVDDCKPVLQSVVECLSASGFLVFGFDNPDRCEETLGIMCPRVIVSDYEMPGFRNGVEFMRDVHADQPERMQIPFVFITAHRGEIASEGYPVIRKPFQCKQLVEHVNLAVVTMLNRQGISSDDEIFDMEIAEDIVRERKQQAEAMKRLRASGLL